MYNVGIIGVTGAVGYEMLHILERKTFPIKNLRCFASPKSQGKTVDFCGEKIRVEIPISFEDIDVVLLSAGKKVSFELIPEITKAGAIAIDNSSAFRMQIDVPLIIPEVNRHLLANHRGVIASPNCVAVIMAMVLAPLHNAFEIERIVAATYQAASGAGAIAMTELIQETQSVLENKPFTRTVMPQPYAFNLFPHNAPMTATGYNEEEVKIIEELRKILEAPALPIAVTSIRVPILRVHSIAVNVTFRQKILPDIARALLSNMSGVTLLEDWENNRFPTPLDVTGQDNIFVGRIRQDLSHTNGLDLWILGDQLLKGAALNTIQIMETLYSI